MFLENHMLCAGHPQWDPKEPGLWVEKLEIWNDHDAKEAKQTKKKRVDMWKSKSDKNEL